MGTDWLTLEEFMGSWLAPSDAVSTFELYGVRMGHERLLKKLRLGIGGLAVCEHAVQRANGTRQDFPLCNVHAAAFIMVNPGDTFWISGDLDVVMFSARGGVEVTSADDPLPYETGAKDIQEWSYVGVRFPPTLIQSILPSNCLTIKTTRRTTPPSPPDPSAAGKVSKRDLSAWAKTYLSDKPCLVFAEIRAAAEVEFAGRELTRQPLRDAIKAANYPVKRGNPSIRRNSTGE